MSKDGKTVSTCITTSTTDPNDPTVTSTSFLCNNSDGTKTDLHDSGTTVTQTNIDQNGQADTKVLGGDAKCTEGNLAACFFNFPGMLFAALALLFLVLASGILYVAGTVFNWVIIRTVFQFATYFGTSQGMLIAWGVLRDIANIGLLFGFIFMGVLLILNVEGGGHGHGHGGGLSARKAIPQLIIFAVLLNFSLFTSQVVIDISNAFSSQFAALAGQQACGSDAVTTGTGDVAASDSTQSCSNYGISGKILQATGLTTILNPDVVFDGLKKLANQPYSYSISLIMLSIFVLVTALVLLAGAIMLVIRVVTLSLLMVTSPIGFAGMAIPKLESIAHDWWSKLISQSFFAPVFMLLIFISIKLTEGLSNGNASLANALIGEQGNTAAGNMQVVMVFLVVIGFMIGSLLAAQKMGAMGASFAASFAKTAVTYPLAIAGRETVGRGSAAAMKAYESGMGKIRANAPKKGIAKFVTGGLLNATDDIVAGGLEQGKNAKFFGQRSFKEEQEHREHRSEHLEHAAHKADQMDELKKAMGAGDNDKAQEVLQQMGTSDIKDVLKDSKADLDMIARNLSPDKFSELMKDKDVGSDKKHALQAGRFKDLQSSISTAAAGGATGFTTAKAAIKQWSNADLTEFAKADPEAFKRLVQMQGADGESLLSDEQREALEKAGGLTNNQRKMVKDNSVPKRIDSYLAGVNGAPPTPIARATAAALARKIKKPKEKASLDAATLTQEEIIDTLTPADMKEIMNEAKLDDAQRSTIMSRIRTSGLANHTAVIDYLQNQRTDAIVKSYWA